jgi:hypothetical protein
MYGSWMYNYLCNQCLYIIITVVSSKPVQGEVYSLLHHVIKFVNNIRQVIYHVNIADGRGRSANWQSEHRNEVIMEMDKLM